MKPYDIPRGEQLTLEMMESPLADEAFVAVNPRWLAWERAGCPGLDGGMPRAGAFVLWNTAHRRAYEVANAGREVPEHESAQWWWERGAAYDAWLLEPERSADHEAAAAAVVAWLLWGAQP